MFLKVGTECEKLHHPPLLQHGDRLAAEHVCPRARNLLAQTNPIITLAPPPSPWKYKGGGAGAGLLLHMYWLAGNVSHLSYLFCFAVHVSEDFVYSFELHIAGTAGLSEQVHH